MSRDEVAAAIQNAQVVDIRPARRAAKSRQKPGVGVYRPEILAAVERINETSALVRHGTSVVVMNEEVGESGRMEISFQASRDFTLWHGNERYTVGDDEQGIGNIWLIHPSRRQYRGVTFHPPSWYNVGGHIAPVCQIPEGYYNLWGGYSVDRAPATPSLDDHRSHFPTLCDHVANNIAGGDPEIEAWLWGWAAHLIQRPTERLGVTPVLQGKMGTGKSVFGRAIGGLLGRHYITISASKHLTGNFNAHMASTLLVQAEEAFWGGDTEAAGVLKDLVTNDHFNMEGKGKDVVRLRNYLHLMITSNEAFVVPAGLEERRWAVFRVNERKMQDKTYFAQLERELDSGGREHLLAWLIGFDLASVSLTTIPATEALWEQKTAAMAPEQMWWLARLRDGRVLAGQDGWGDADGRVIVKDLYRDYVEFVTLLGRRSRKSEEQLAQELVRLLPQGYPRRSRPWVTATSNGQSVRVRERCYEFPPLQVCRDHFAALARHAIDWGRDDDQPEPSE